MIENEGTLSLEEETELLVSYSRDLTRFFKYIQEEIESLIKQATNDGWTEEKLIEEILKFVDGDSADIMENNIENVEVIL